MPVSSLYMYVGNAVIFLALCSVFWWRKRHLVEWPYFGWGALAWLLGACGRSAWASLGEQPLQDWLHVASSGLMQAVGWALDGGIAALIDCAALLAVVGWAARLRVAGRDEAIGFGLGAAATAAVLYGLQVIFSLLSTLLLLSTRMKPDDVHNFHLAGPPLLWTLVPIAMQLSLMFIHTAQGAWLVYARRARDWRYFWLLVASLAAVNALVLVMLDQFAQQRLGTVWGLQVLLGAWAWLSYRSLQATADRFASLAEDQLLSQNLSKA